MATLDSFSHTRSELDTLTTWTRTCRVDIRLPLRQGCTSWSGVYAPNAAQPLCLYQLLALPLPPPKKKKKNASQEAGGSLPQIISHLAFKLVLAIFNAPFFQGTVLNFHKKSKEINASHTSPSQKNANLSSTGGSGACGVDNSLASETTLERNEESFTRY